MSKEDGRDTQMGDDEAAKDQEGIYRDRGGDDDAKDDDQQDDDQQDDDSKDDQQDDDQQDDDQQDDDQQDDDDDKSADDDQDDDKDKSDDKKSDDDSPYGDLEIPDGVEINDDRMKEFMGLAAELELKPESLQKLLDLGLAQLAENSKTQAEAGAAAVTAQADKWLDELKVSLKKQKMDFKKASVDALDAIERFGGTKKEIAQLKELLGATGIGNHPVLVPLLARAGAAIQEDTVVTGDDAGDVTGGDDIADEGIYKGKTYK